MAMISISTIVPSKGQVCPTVKGITQNAWGTTGYCFPLQKKSAAISLLKVHYADNQERSGSDRAYKINIPRSEACMLETGSTERQLKVLGSYFCKHHDMDEKPSSLESSSCTEYHMRSSSELEDQMTEADDISIDRYKTKTSLDYLENYFGELSAGEKTRKVTSPALGEEISSWKKRLVSAIGACPKNEKVMAVPNRFEHFESIDNYADKVLSNDEDIRGLHMHDEASDFYLINLLVAINIGVFLFEIASPIRNSEVEHLSLPLMYGAKINKLILVGEWWRLFTPMFLVQN